MPPCLLRAARRRSGRADEGRTPVRGVPQPLVRSALSWAGSRPEAPVSFGSPGILRSASPAQRRSGCAVGGSRFSGDPCLMWCRSGPMEQASSAPVRADGKRVRKPVRAHPARNGDVPGEAKETCTASAAWPWHLLSRHSGPLRCFRFFPRHAGQVGGCWLMNFSHIRHFPFPSSYFVNGTMRNSSEICSYTAGSSKWSLENGYSHSAGKRTSLVVTICISPLVDGLVYRSKSNTMYDFNGPYPRCTPGFVFGSNFLCWSLTNCTLHPNGCIS